MRPQLPGAPSVGVETCPECTRSPAAPWQCSRASVPASRSRPRHQCRPAMPPSHTTSGGALGVGGARRSARPHLPAASAVAFVVGEAVAPRTGPARCDVRQGGVRCAGFSFLTHSMPLSRRSFSAQPALPGRHRSPIGRKTGRAHAAVAVVAPRRLVARHPGRRQSMTGGSCRYACAGDAELAGRTARRPCTGALRAIRLSRRIEFGFSCRVHTPFLDCAGAAAAVGSAVSAPPQAACHRSLGRFAQCCSRGRPFSR